MDVRYRQRRRNAVAVVDTENGCGVRGYFVVEDQRNCDFAACVIARLDRKGFEVIFVVITPLIP